VGSVQIGECCAEQVKTLADTTWFTFSLLPLWSEEQGTVNCPCVTVILAWSALMTSYKPHRLVRVVFDATLTSDKPLNTSASKPMKSPRLMIWRFKQAVSGDRAIVQAALAQLGDGLLQKPTDISD
jgi:hypothetical protein